MRAKIKFAMNLIEFGRKCIPEMCSKPSPPFHFKLAEFLMDISRQLINLVAPRGHAKSSVVACVFVLWHVFLEDIYRYVVGNTKLYSRRPKFVVLISKTQGEAIRRLDTIKAVIGDEDGAYSAPFRNLFGDYGYGTHKSWTKTQIVLKDGTMFLAVGTGQQARGLKNIHQRPTLILPDDPEDEENTKTSERMDGNMRWLLQAIIPSLDADIGRCVVIGTPQNHGCMVVSLHNSVGWTSAWFGNDLKTNSSTWDGDKYDHREVLWPELMGQEKLKDKMDMARSLGRMASYYREYECKVVGDEDQLFKPEYFKDYDGELLEDLIGNTYLKITHQEKGGILEELQEPIIKAVNVFMGVDPASSTSQTADYTVIMVGAMDRERNIYVVDYIRRRMAPASLLLTVENTYNIYSPIRSKVETIAAQEYIVSLLKEKGIFMIGDKPRTGKEERLVHLEPKFSQGKVYTKVHMQDLKKEFLDFPRGKHDDIMDAFDLMQGIAYPPVHDAILSEDAAKARKKRKFYDPMLA
jgi:predicted phage terminase large subunit-like protein